MKSEFYFGPDYPKFLIKKSLDTTKNGENQGLSKQSFLTLLKLRKWKRNSITQWIPR